VVSLTVLYIVIARDGVPELNTRFLTEFILSVNTRFLALLGMTESEGFGMTSEGPGMTK